MRRAAFLDRDGVLNERPPPGCYVTSWEGFRWLPGARAALARLRRAGYALVVVSNQRGVARGLVDERELDRIARGIRADLARDGTSILGIYHCPHELAARCTCRKPAPGLLVHAARRHSLSLEASVMVGDAESDVLAGRAAGCRTVRVGPAGCASSADLRAPDLAAAARLLAR